MFHAVTGEQRSRKYAESRAMSVVLERGTLRMRSLIAPCRYTVASPVYQRRSKRTVVSYYECKTCLIKKAFTSVGGVTSRSRTINSLMYGLLQLWFLQSDIQY
jgi:hypothetical protein